MKATINEMRTAYFNNELEVLTLDAAKSLEGKKIQTFFFGYDHQDGVDEFVIGEIISEYELAKRNTEGFKTNQAEYWESYMTEKQLNEMKTTLQIITTDGRKTYIRHNPIWNRDNEFHCSDVDRTVFYRVAE